MSMTLVVIFGCWQSGINEHDLRVSGDIFEKIYVYPVAIWVGSLKLLDATWSQ